MSRNKVLRTETRCIQEVWRGDRRCELLSAAGFTIADYQVDVPEAGTRVDIIATGIADISFFVLCVPERRDGLARINGDTGLRAALARCMRLRAVGLGPNLLLTRSGFPETWVGAALDGVDRECLYDLVSLDRDLNRLRWLARAGEDALRADMGRQASLCALLAQRRRRLSRMARQGLPQARSMRQEARACASWS